MKFNDLAWGAVCFYYKSVGDSKYSRIMRDTSFLYKLRIAPTEASVSDFEEKVILDYVNIQNYDLLVGQRFADSILSKLVKLQPLTSSLIGVNLLDCDLSDTELVGNINRIYTELLSVQGLWLTGVSKIVHLLNDTLFPLINPEISEHFELVGDHSGFYQWLKVTQREAKEVTNDFYEQRLPGSPEQFLSNKLGYTHRGHQKSLVRFIDEYFWLRFRDNLPIPPVWIPASTD